MKKTLFVIAIALGFLTAVQVGITQERTQQKNDMQTVAEPNEPSIGGSFTLTNQDGKTVHDSDFHGRVMLVSFGFTRCPDICPITVATLSKTMELLGAKADMVSPLFITVDPSHDTPPVLKDFLSNFDKRMVGLTGTQVQIKQVADAYKVYYAASPGNKEDSFDHSGYIYMMGKDGQFLHVFPYNVPERELAQAVEAVLR